MKNILITGGTGNIGRELIRYLHEIPFQARLTIAARDVEKDREILGTYPDLLYVPFDFQQGETFSEAFEGQDIIFLLRPPQLSDVDGIFRPMLAQAKAQGIKKIVFLSVQGVEASSIIPHHKMEKLILEMEFEYIFVRPSYFMQNLSTTLLSDIQKERKIVLPAGMAKFLWIDAQNIGEATAYLIADFDQHKNKPLEITGTELLHFQEVARQMSEVLGKKITYQSLNPLSFFLRKKREGMSTGFALVMIMLHFLPRFQPPPPITEHYQLLTGKKPTSLREFIDRERQAFASRASHQKT